MPADIIEGRSVASTILKPKTRASTKKPQPLSNTVLPRDFKVHYGNDRLRDIRRELVKLKREEFPNAGAVLLRVFFELAVLDYLERIGELPKIVEKLEKQDESGASHLARRQ